METILFIPSTGSVYRTRDGHKLGYLAEGSTPHGSTHKSIISILETDTPPEPPPTSIGGKISPLWDDSEIHLEVKAA